MKHYTITDIGKKRKNNEDSLLVKKQSGFDIMLICDGMGGHNSGEVASNMATNIVDSFDFDDSIDILSQIKALIQNINIKIYLKSKSSPDFNNMGTTFSLAVVYNEKLYIGHIGDSRIYSIANDKINLITEDHSYANVLKSSGIEVKNNEYKNLIVKSVGTSSVIDPDLIEIDLKCTQFIFMCTDGVTNYLTDEEMLEIITRNSEENILKEMLDICLERGGNDNISAILSVIGE